jgi:hypothetical protein
MRRDIRIEAEWRPRAGSYEEAVLDWYEQVEKVMSGVRRGTRAADRRTGLPHVGGRAQPWAPAEGRPYGGNGKRTA